MQKIKNLIFILILLAVFFFFCGPPSTPDNNDFKKILSSKTDADLIIIFNSGGWGDTSVEEAQDLTPIVKNIEKFLSGNGYKSVVVPYQRTKEGFVAKFVDSKEFFNNFQKQSSEAADNIEIFLKKNPGKKVLMVGLSAGAVFADETMRKINNFKEPVFAIEIGIPFWQKKFDSQNTLFLNNKNGDSLTKGEIKVLLSALFKAIPKWVGAKISGSELSFSLAFDFPAHHYFWDSPEVGSKIIAFLNEKLQ